MIGTPRAPAVHGLVKPGSHLVSTPAAVVAARELDEVEFVLRVQPGRVVALEGPTGLGMTRLGLGMVQPVAARVPVVAVDVRGWLCPLAAWEIGIPPEHLHLVRCSDPMEWPKALAALLEGINAVYAEVPKGVPDQVLRRLGALARARGVALVLRPLDGHLPAGLAYLRVRAVGVEWSGPDAGHGRLAIRRLQVEVSGKGASGVQRMIEVEDHGANTVRVLSGVATAAGRRAAG